MKNVWDQLRLKGIEPWDYETARRAEEGMPSMRQGPSSSCGG